MHHSHVESMFPDNEAHVLYNTIHILFARNHITLYSYSENMHGVKIKTNLMSYLT